MLIAVELLITNGILKPMRRSLLLYFRQQIFVTEYHRSNLIEHFTHHTDNSNVSMTSIQMKKKTRKLQIIYGNVMK